MTEPVSLNDLNTTSKDSFVDTLGGIFEHSPWVAEQVHEQRPFSSVTTLHQAMVAIVKESTIEARQQLICSHPELAGKEAKEGGLTDDSKNEQASAGLDQCTPQELAKLNQLNAVYRDKFHFPFIIAVRGRNRQEIMEDMEARIGNAPQVEFERCIDEIARIAELRLNALLNGN